MAEPDFKEVAKGIVCPWEEFNINAWGEDMGSSARAHLIQLVAQALATARADAWDEVIQAIQDVDGLLFLDDENDFSWGMFMDWLEERKPK